MNLFSIEYVYLFSELTVGVVKWIFCYKEGLLMETDPFPANKGIYMNKQSGINMLKPNQQLIWYDWGL